MHHIKATTTYVRMHAYIHTLEYTRCTQELSAASKKQDKQSSALEKLEGELQQVRKELEEKRLKGREWADQVCTYAFNICMRVCMRSCVYAYMRVFANSGSCQRTHRRKYVVTFSYASSSVHIYTLTFMYCIYAHISVQVIAQQRTITELQSRIRRAEGKVEVAQEDSERIQVRLVVYMNAYMKYSSVPS